MRKCNGDEYKEYSVKTMWNVAAKMMQEKYYLEHGLIMNPFSYIEFKCARDVRNAKRMEQQKLPEK
ncbi:hypothetical protein C0J52_22782 [Blattella germanica]|nr:hypothetical protein C0J52_22782 [Blattella germanica]